MASVVDTLAKELERLLPLAKAQADLLERTVSFKADEDQIKVAAGKVHKSMQKSQLLEG